MALIITHQDTTGYAPVDERWCAYEDSYDGSPGQFIGKGPTEDAAISDLEAQLDAADEAAEAARDGACEWCNGTGFVTISTRIHAYVCAGEPPEDARHVAAAICCECHSHYRRERAA